tara:strand:+ start:1723 stop:1986 length:264 start_codon:yes stop_codon:yes gene_type:complete
MKYKVGDRVIFKKLLVDDASKWLMTEREFEQVKTFLDKIGTIDEIEKRFNDNGTITYFLTVRFSSGYKLTRVNRYAFVPFEVDFDYI